MQKFKTPYNKEQFPTDLEYNPLPSLTVPDMSMSVKEILIRHSQGLPFEAGKVPMYDDAEDFNDFLPNLATLDISEKKELFERTKAFMDDWSGKQKKAREEKAAALKLEQEEKDKVYRLWKEGQRKPTQNENHGGNSPALSAGGDPQ